ncbi:MAG TPA: isochorismatase family protein [Actinocrinis sp.]|nr:isochorismatase family protein [Actinocrinis sp.]
MTSALLIIDVQESFRRRPLWQAVSNPDIVDDVTRLVRAARSAGDLVIWCLHAEPGTGTEFDPAGGYVRLIEPLAALPDEPVLTKSSANAFTTTNLQQLLTMNGVSALTICGIQTEQCCETTTRLASDLGYQVTFVTDATATFPIPHRDAPQGRSVGEILADPRTLTTPAIVERTEYALSGRFATLSSVQELTGSLTFGAMLTGS